MKEENVFGLKLNCNEVLGLVWVVFWLLKLSQILGFWEKVPFEVPTARSKQ